MSDTIVAVLLVERRVVDGFVSRSEAQKWLDKWLGKSQSRVGFVSTTEPHKPPQDEPSGLIENENISRYPVVEP